MSCPLALSTHASLAFGQRKMVHTQTTRSWKLGWPCDSSLVSIHHKVHEDRFQLGARSGVRSLEIGRSGEKTLKEENWI